MTNQTPHPSAKAGPVGVNCPTCGAKPTKPCVGPTGARRRPHRARLDKAGMPPRPDWVAK